MTTAQITLLISLLCMMKSDCTGGFASNAMLVHSLQILAADKAISAGSEPENNLPIPEFEDFRPFLETSGVVARSEWHKYPIESETGLYGFYTLFTPEKKYLGELIIHFPKSINDWRMDDPDQSFIRVVIEGEGIDVLPGLTIGINREQLYILLGKPLYQSQDCVVYRDQSGTYVKVELEEEKVIKIDYGLYSKPYLDSIRSRTGECG